MLYIRGHGHERRTHPWRREIGRPRLAPLPKFLLDVAFKIFDVKNWRRWNLLHHHFISFGIKNYKAIQAGAKALIGLEDNANKIQHLTLLIKLDVDAAG